MKIQSYAYRNPYNNRFLLSVKSPYLIQTGIFAAGLWRCPMTIKLAQSVAAGTIPSADSGSLFAKAQDALASTARRLKEARAMQQAIWEMEQLDDHALRDIGLNRSDIRTYVRGLRK
jgi:uncharacterized protein YjiS (DUF1127 family)